MADLMPEGNTLIVDGRQVGFEAGKTLLSVLLDVGIDLPHVCYLEPLGPLQTCDTCLVEVDGQLRRACATLPDPKSRVGVASQQAKRARLEATQRLMHKHELYCTVCDNNNGDCALKSAVRSQGIGRQELPFQKKPYPVDDSNPFYVYDPSQCIQCGRCVEACQDVQVNETLSIDWDLPVPRVVWDGGVPIDESSCVSCGHCVTVCPVNALMEKSMLGKAGTLTGMRGGLKRSMIDMTKALEPAVGLRPVMLLSDAEAEMRRTQVKKTKTVCTYCGVGCAFDVWTKGRDILKIQPVPEAPANGISTCVKGKFGWDFVNSAERLTAPLIREGDAFRRATWEEAVGLVARRLTDIKASFGPDGLGFIASSKCTNEESYLTQKLARQVVGTNNIDNCSRYCQAPATTGLWRTVGYGGDAGSLRDIEQADLVIIVGSNTAESHPVLATRIKRAQKLRGQKVVVADLRKHEMARRADLFLHPRPGTDLFWLSAVSRILLERGWADKGFLEEKVEGLAAFEKSLQPFALEQASAVTGLSEEDLLKVAEWIRQAGRVCILWAMGVTQHQGGSDTSTAISNLLLVSGNYGRPGTGAYPLRGHNNVQGASDFGSMPTYLPGYQKVADPEVRRRFSKAWGADLTDRPGADNHQMIEAIHQGTLHGLYIVGEDIAVVDCSVAYTEEALKKVDFLVVQDVFLSRTAQFADVVLPAAPSLEKEGTFTNTERRIQRLYPALDPLGDALPDWKILQLVARAMGAPWDYGSPRDVMEEAARLTPMFSGVSYERLEGYKSLQWPVSPDGQDTPYLYAEGFHFENGKARLYPLSFHAPAAPSAEFPLHLNNGRILEHFHEGNLTYKSAGIRQKVPGTFVEVSEELASDMGLADGDPVRLVSPWGQIKVKVLVTDRVAGGELYLPMNDAGEGVVNRLTGLAIDRATDTPAFKELPVRLEKLEGGGEAPLPRTNPRFGHPTPQEGVRVHQKWNRPDYTLPGEGAKGRG